MGNGLLTRQARDELEAIGNQRSKHEGCVLPYRHCAVCFDLIMDWRDRHGVGLMDLRNANGLLPLGRL
jgi:hypothetical protein